MLGTLFVIFHKVVYSQSSYDEPVECGYIKG